MFTGIVLELGRVTTVREIERGREFEIDPGRLVERFVEGASVAVNGTCLTVAARSEELIRVQAVEETLRATNLGDLREGEVVNLEPALRAGDEMGGHIVQGHVDTVAEVSGIHHGEMDRRIDFQVAPDFGKYLVPKGSVAIDGVSMTVGPTVEPTAFHVFVIPYTWEKTRFGIYRQGTRVNVEVDILGKYVRHFLSEGDEGEVRDAIGGHS